MPALGAGIHALRRPFAIIASAKNKNKGVAMTAEWFGVAFVPICCAQQFR